MSRFPIHRSAYAPFCSEAHHLSSAANKRLSNRLTFPYRESSSAPQSWPREGVIPGTSRGSLFVINGGKFSIAVMPRIPKA
jgi:hypothetical protein